MTSRLLHHYWLPWRLFCPGCHRELRWSTPAASCRDLSRPPSDIRIWRLAADIERGCAVCNGDSFNANYARRPAGGRAWRWLCRVSGLEWGLERVAGVCLTCWDRWERNRGDC